MVLIQIRKLIRSELSIRSDSPSVDFVSISEHDSCFFWDNKFFDFVSFRNARQVYFFEDENILLRLESLLKSFFLNLVLIIVFFILGLFLSLIIVSILWLLFVWLIIVRCVIVIIFWAFFISILVSVHC